MGETNYAHNRKLRLLETVGLLRYDSRQLVCPGGIRSDKLAGLLLAKARLCSEIAIIGPVLLYRASNSDNDSSLLTSREPPLFVPRSSLWFPDLICQCVSPDSLP